MPLTNATTQTPQHYLVLLYHGHQLLDSAGPLDILSTISKQPEGAGYTLTLAAETLDPVNLSPVPPRAATWEFESSSDFNVAAGKPYGAGFNPRLYPDVTFADALASLRAKGVVEVENCYGQREERPVDVLFIPGGIGSRLYRVEKGSGEKTLNVQSCVDFAQQLCVEGLVRSAVLTVCTGSDLFARTGLLDGRRATTNYRGFSMVSQRHQSVKWLEKRRWVRSTPAEVSQPEGQGNAEPKANRAAYNREIWTSAGISAGMDLMLWFVAEVYGTEFARRIARLLEYEWRETVAEGEVDPYYN